MDVLNVLETVSNANKEKKMVVVRYTDWEENYQLEVGWPDFGNNMAGYLFIDTDAGESSAIYIENIKDIGIFQK